jgi:hypothetical protein
MDLDTENKFKSLLTEFERQTQEQVLFDVLTQFYFADWTRACEYKKMTAEDVVEAAMSVCRNIEKQYNYSLDNDLF